MSNPTGTMIAEVYRHDGILTIGSTQYAVYLKPSASTFSDAFAPRTEVVVMNDAYYKETDGPNVTWTTPTTLAVKSEAGRAFITGVEPLQAVRRLQVHTAGKATRVTAKLFIPSL